MPISICRNGVVDLLFLQENQANKFFSVLALANKTENNNRCQYPDPNPHTDFVGYAIFLNACSGPNKTCIQPNGDLQARKYCLHMHLKQYHWPVVVIHVSLLQRFFVTINHSHSMKDCFHSHQLKVSELLFDFIELHFHAVNPRVR